MNWDRYNELIALRDSGRIEEATTELANLGAAETDPAIKAVVLTQVAGGLGLLRRFSEARGKVREACTLLGPEHGYYPRLALEAAVLDIDEGDWKEGLKKLNAILEKYSAILQLDDNKDLLEQVQRNRGIALFEMRRFREARPILETVRSLPYQRERTLCSLGMCNYELEDLDAAKRDFEELLSLNPGAVFPAYAHYYLGRILYAYGQYARAKSELEKCLASSARGNVSDQILLQGLIYSCKALNWEDEATHYSAMLKKAQVAP